MRVDRESTPILAQLIAEYYPTRKDISAEFWKWLVRLLVVE